MIYTCVPFAYGEGYLEWLFPGAYEILPEGEFRANRLVLSAGYHDLLRERLKVEKVNWLKSGFIAVEERFPAHFTGLNDTWGISVVKSSAGYHYATAHEQNAALDSDVLEGKFLYAVDSRSLRSRIYGGAGLAGSKKFIWDMGVCARPCEPIRLFYFHQSGVERSYLRYDYQGEPVEAPFAFTVSTDSYGAELHLSREFYLQCGWHFSWLGTDDSLDEDFTLKPWVRLQRFRGTAGFALSRKIRLGAGWSSFAIGGGARLLNSGVSYGKFTAIEGEFQGPLVKTDIELPSGRDFTLEWEWLEAEGFIRGHLEFWPFTPALIDLLGYRRYFRGWMEAWGQRYSASTSFPCWKGVSVNPGLHFIDLFMDGEFSSWQPEWLVFGKTDERISPLRIRRLQAVLVRLGLTVPWGAAVSIDYRFQQWVPVKVSKSSRTGTAAGPGDPGMKPESSDGGRVHQISITVDLEKLKK